MHSRRSAFTLVELLVVMAIIGILVALLLPSVQAAREAARRIQCRNNLKQISLAVIGYENARKRYPPCGLAGPNTADLFEGPFNPRSGKMIGWVVLVLPYMEETPLYQQFDLSANILNQTSDPQAVPIRSMFCPSDDGQGRIYSDSVLTAGKRFAKGNYAAYVSPIHVSFTDWWPGGLSGNHRYASKDIADGLTNTILLSEVRTRDNEQDQRGAWALPWCGSTTLSFDMHAVFPLYYNTDLPKEPFNASGLPYKAWPGNLGETQRPNNTGPEQDMLYTCPDAAGSQLDGMPCAQFQPNFDWGWLSAAPRSRHQGGVYVAFLDGRVVFVPDNIDEYTMAYLVSPNDGQTIDKSPLQ